MPDQKPTLDYYAPERQPWLTVHWGGWVFLAIVIIALAGELFDALMRR